jgi:copper chaperone CopZ
MTTELKIEGMTCGHCVIAVRKALEAVPGVQTAEVNLAGGKATVDGNAELAALVEAVEEEGYTAVGQ